MNERIVGDIEVAHGAYVVVLQIGPSPNRVGYTAEQLTPDEADRLALALVRQAAYARSVADEERP